MKNQPTSTKKLVLFALTLILTFTTVSFIGCKKQDFLSSKVVELRSNVYEGASDSYTLSAQYGFTTSNNVKTYALTFKLANKELDNAEYLLQFNYNDLEYKSTFTLNPLTDVKTAVFNIQDFNEKTFNVTITNGSNSEEITLNSLLPENTLPVNVALKKLYENQNALVKNYIVDGEFGADITARVIVRDNKPYWFICFTKGNERRALLVDGHNGEVLAIREIF